jgi:hypothetical protein
VEREIPPGTVRDMDVAAGAPMDGFTAFLKKQFA